jgi:aspartate 1-decarboxylase
MCISKLHRLIVTRTEPEGGEALVVDEDILDAAGFPPGIEVQFTSLKNGAIRRTHVKAGRRGSGMAEIHGAGAQYIEAGTRLVTLAEAWLPYDEAVKIGGPQVAFFDETRSDKNVIREIKPGYRPR